MDRHQLELYLNNLLHTAHFKDYCPNGLQVEGRPRISRIATGVTASLDCIEGAVKWGADALLVHHGYFWKNEAPQVTGLKQARLRALLVDDLNLFAYHLPLDAHPDLGNNAQLGEQLGWLGDAAIGADGLIWTATLPVPMTLESLSAHIEKTLRRRPLVIGELAKPVRRVAWCTGAAQGFFEEAIAAGADVYVSGEISEQTTHLARESGVAYIAAGHHATERYGIQALGAHLADAFGFEHIFIDIDNPV